MKKIYSSNNRVLLYILKDRLEAAGIHCLLKNQDVAGQAAGELPPVVAKPELWVMKDNDFDQAKRLVEEEMDEQQQNKPDWCCNHCGEVIEGQFDICWNCDSSK